jgi:uncharacterized membrane protein YjjB (DUF3815 family)
MATATATAAATTTIELLSRRIDAGQLAWALPAIGPFWPSRAA